MLIHLYLNRFWRPCFGNNLESKRFGYKMKINTWENDYRLECSTTESLMDKILLLLDTYRKCCGPQKHVEKGTIIFQCSSPLVPEKESQLTVCRELIGLKTKWAGIVGGIGLRGGRNPQHLVKGAKPPKVTYRMGCCLPEAPKGTYYFPSFLLS